VRTGSDQSKLNTVKTASRSSGASTVKTGPMGGGSDDDDKDTASIRTETSLKGISRLIKCFMIYLFGFMI